MRPYYCLTCRQYNERNEKGLCEWNDRCKNIYDVFRSFVEKTKAGQYKKKGITWSYSIKDAVYRAPYQYEEKNI
jgi:hypothetical protein